MTKKQSTKALFTKPTTMRMRVLIALGAIIAIFALAMTVHYIDNRTKVAAPSRDDKVGITIYGELVCLPKKGDGPHTMECVSGLKDDEGNHFSLVETSSSAVPDTGNRVKVDGVFVPVDKSKTQYDIEGSIRYASIKVVE